ncbi:MAG: C4-dicarboxylic acid transporter DauA [Hahellaceae bacterium]|nr:C4-dicarboxylic acid transporter DauA [Hahellaceae bacterium]
MPHRSHLLSLRLGHALRESLQSGYSRRDLLADMIAGLTIGIIAIPLSMALAIASGVAPQYGLYTAIIAGFVIALTGGSRFSISGPTAAFVVILFPVAEKFGLGGLLLATLMAGCMLVLMALLRLGRLIEYIPEPVTLGFTGGIAIVIAFLQVPDFLGLTLNGTAEHFLGKLMLIGTSLGTLQPAALLVALATLMVFLLWPRLKMPIPAHLPAVVVGTVTAATINALGGEVETIGSRFTYLLADGTPGQGIPPILPHFEWPWLQPGPGGQPLDLSWTLIQALLPAAFAMAMLGAIESLLCAVVLDGMTGRRHSANSELLGQGLGNLIAPFWGGITATAALARSAANVRAGARSPIAAMTHAGVVLLALAFLANVLAWIPMPAMAAMLMIVAWNMSEAPKALRLLKKVPGSDIAVFFTCLVLTVVFDMVIAITAGILLAALLFLKDIAAMTKVADISQNDRWVDCELPQGWRVYKINGPLFFAAADRVFGELRQLAQGARGIVLYLDAVPLLDAGGLSAFEHFLATSRAAGTQVYVADVQFQPLKTLAKADIQPDEHSRYFSSLRQALDALPEAT